MPDLARGLVEKIDEAHQNNPRFIEAFDAFFELCQHVAEPEPPPRGRRRDARAAPA